MVLRATSVADLVAVLERGALSREPSEGAGGFSQLDHGLQCAAVLERAHPDDLELQAAGLLHDIGHTLVPADVAGHGRHGRAYVEDLLGPRVGALIELHVPAKRWLVTVDPDYRARLSPGSVRTLTAQGEELTIDERRAFEAEEHHRGAVVLRRADEAAKVAGLRIAGLARWVPMLTAVTAAAPQRSGGS